jgi:diacylglycerol kinase family enzyme
VPHRRIFVVVTNFPTAFEFDMKSIADTRATGARMTAIINTSAPQTATFRAEWLREFLHQHGIDGEIALAGSGSEIGQLARTAAQSESELIIAAGGDGTINAVAAQLIGTGKKLGVLPLGTLNHFAKDLAIPQDLEAALKVILQGRAVRIDVASVNGHFFLNNSSLGLYPRLVAARQRQQQAGWKKWLAWVPALWRTLRSYPVLAVRIKSDEHHLVRRTPIVFVGNNRYELEGWGIGSRACLDEALLHVSVARGTGRWALVRMIVYSLFGWLGAVSEIDSLCTEELLVQTRRRRLMVAIDGEVVLIETPLQYQIHPGALSVMVPR